MNAADLLASLRSRGVCILPDGANLRVNAPADVLTPELRAKIQAQKPALLAALQMEAGELAELVERTGRQAQALAQEGHRWQGADYDRRRDALSRNIDKAHALLLARGEALTVYGWDCTKRGEWYRVTEAPAAHHTTPQAAFLALAARIEAGGGEIGAGPDWERAWKRFDAAANTGTAAAVESACEALYRLACGEPRTQDQPAGPADLFAPAAAGIPELPAAQLTGVNAKNAGEEEELPAAGSLFAALAPGRPVAYAGLRGS